MINILLIDAEGLERLSRNAKLDPSTGKTLKAKTVCDGAFRSVTYVRDLALTLTMPEYQAPRGKRRRRARSSDLRQG